MIQQQSILGSGIITKSRWLASFLPCLAEIFRPENGRTEMIGADRGEQRSLITRIADHMMYDVAEEYRVGKLKSPSRFVPFENPRAFARTDQHYRFAHATPSTFRRLRRPDETSSAG